MTATERILSLLDGVRKTGDGRWIAKCPSHEDQSPSLAIREADDRVLLHDHAGCSPEEICSALGITLSDLFDGEKLFRTRDPEEQRRSRILKGLDLWANERLTHSLRMFRESDWLIDQLSAPTWKLLTEEHPSAGKAWDLLADVISMRERYDREVEVLTCGDRDDKLELYLRIHEGTDLGHTERRRVTA